MSESKWIKTSEQNLPEIDQEVLCREDYTEKAKEYYGQGYGSHITDYYVGTLVSDDKYEDHYEMQTLHRSTFLERIKYWMPIPPLPEEE